jgi:hypothetical protein
VYSKTGSLWDQWFGNKEISILEAFKQTWEPDQPLSPGKYTWGVTIAQEGDCNSESAMRSEEKNFIIQSWDEILSNIVLSECDSIVSENLDGYGQLVLTGDGGGTWKVHINNGVCVLTSQEIENPDAKITISTKDFSRIITGTKSPLDLYQAGSILFEGNQEIINAILMGMNTTDTSNPPPDVPNAPLPSSPPENPSEPNYPPQPDNPSEPDNPLEPNYPLEPDYPPQGMVIFPENYYRISTITVLKTENGKEPQICKYIDTHKINHMVNNEIAEVNTSRTVYPGSMDCSSSEKADSTYQVNIYSGNFVQQGDTDNIYLGIGYIGNSEGYFQSGDINIPVWEINENSSEGGWRCSTKRLFDKVTGIAVYVEQLCLNTDSGDAMETYLFSNSSLTTNAPIGGVRGEYDFSYEK